MTERRQSQKRAGGFTLVELLTVIAILGMLIALVAPSVQSVWKNFKVNKTKMYIQHIVTAIESYRTDHDELPPSDGSYPCPQPVKKVTPDNGAAGLVQCLQGLKGFDDDGMSGMGFRKARAGKTFGPYAPEGMPMTTIENEDPRFLDAFGNEILYYRWETTGTPGFRSAHNANKGPTDIMKYARNPAPADTARPYYKQDYLVISPGPDRVWAENVTVNTLKVDDIANFSFYVKEKKPS